MTGDVSKLSKINDIHLILVNMPNGKTSMASKLGMVRLNSKILLHDVLFVPDLTCNLISTTQLINDLVCIVIFTPKLFVIQGHLLRTPIGVGEQRRGVYLFKEDEPRRFKVNKVDTCSLWHQRLGHASKGVMSLFSSKIGFFEYKGSDKV